eukprot:5131705-Amphidinium_carterae.1
MPTYGEEFVLHSSLRYRILYVPIYQVIHGASVDELAAIVEQAATLIRSDFPVPAEKPDLSILGKILYDLAAEDHVTDLVINRKDSTRRASSIKTAQCMQ